MRKILIVLLFWAPLAQAIGNSVPLENPDRARAQLRNWGIGSLTSGDQVAMQKLADGFIRNQPMDSRVERLNLILQQGPFLTPSDQRFVLWAVSQIDEATTRKLDPSARDSLLRSWNLNVSHLLAQANLEVEQYQRIWSLILTGEPAHRERLVRQVLEQDSQIMSNALADFNDLRAIRWVYDQHLREVSQKEVYKERDYTYTPWAKLLEAMMQSQSKPTFAQLKVMNHMLSEMLQKELPIALRMMNLAFASLASRQHPSSVARVAELLKDDSPAIRAAAVHVLGSTLGVHDPNWQAHVVTALQHFNLSFQRLKGEFDAASGFDRARIKSELDREWQFIFEVLGLLLHQEVPLRAEIIQQIKDLLGFRYANSQVALMIVEMLKDSSRGGGDAVVLQAIRSITESVRRWDQEITPKFLAPAVIMVIEMITEKDVRDPKVLQELSSAIDNCKCNFFEIKNMNIYGDFEEQMAKYPAPKDLFDQPKPNQSCVVLLFDRKKASKD